MPKRASQSDPASRILALDFDGVLNSLRYFEGQRRLREIAAERPKFPLGQFDPLNIGYLNRLVERSRCLIVVSSSWRDGYRVEGLRTLLQSVGFQHPLRIIGKTPRGASRGAEIAAWLTWNGVEPRQLVILDDDRDMDHLLPRLVQTSFQTGLRPRHIAKALELWGEIGDDG